MDWAARSSTFPTMVIPPLRRRRSPHLSRLFRRSIFPSDRECPTADGNSHTLDVLYSAATNKQFITLQSKNGNTFYLVIDYDKPIDEDAEMYETYFLNLVDEKDLLALMSDEEKADLPTPTPEIIYVTPEPTAVPAPTTVHEPQPSSKSDQQTAILALIAMLVLGAAGTFILFKNKGNGKKNRADNDFLMDDEDDEAES